MCQKSCGSTVEAALRGVPGVVSAKASFENSNAIIVGTASAEELIDAIECVGFEASRAEPSTNVSSKERFQMHLKQRKPRSTAPEDITEASNTSLLEISKSLFSWIF